MRSRCTSGANAAWTIAIALLAGACGGSSTSTAGNAIGDPCAEVVCTPSDSCHLAGECNPANGLCAAGAAVSCPSGEACDLSDGQCRDRCANVMCGDVCHASVCDPSTGSCSPGTSPCASGYACESAGSTYKCVDLCSGVTCPAQQTCDPGTGQCQTLGRTPSAQVVRDLAIGGPPALAMDAAGNVYLAASISSATSVSFDGFQVSSPDGTDVFLARFGADGVARWAVGFSGNGSRGLRVGSGAAATADGTVAVLGNFSGPLQIGAGSLTSSAQIDFLAGVNGASGAGVWAKQFDNGGGGRLRAVAANGNDSSAAHGNRLAVCGYANGGAPSDLVGAGATFPAGSDIVIAAFKSDGTSLWAIQVASPGDEDCSAVAIDDNGDVYAAGSYAGSPLSFGGATSVLAPPGSTTPMKYAWVAKFDGGTGAAILAADFASEFDGVMPTSLSVDNGGNVFMGGQFTSDVTFVNGDTLLSAGASDGYVVKLTGALAPVWAIRLGGPGADVVSGVAADAGGDVLATGFFNKATDGAAALTAASTTEPDAFALLLSGATGATDFASSYGDAAAQTGDCIVANRFAGTQFAIAGTFSGTVAFGAPDGAVTAASGGVDVFLVIGQLQ